MGRFFRKSKKIFGARVKNGLFIKKGVADTIGVAYQISSHFNIYSKFENWFSSPPEGVPCRVEK